MLTVQALAQCAAFWRLRVGFAQVALPDLLCGFLCSHLLRCTEHDEETQS